jgi:proteasome-associated ATPase
MSSPSRALEIVEKLRDLAPKDDQKLQMYLSALADELQKGAAESEETARMLEEYEAAYQKLTQPANRLGVFLNWLEEKTALVALGDTEYVAMVDPKIVEEDLETGSRVKLNDAYAVVGAIPVAQSGPLVKVSEALEDGRLRIGSEMPGSDGRFVLRSKDLAEAKINPGDEVRLESSGRIAVEHFEKKENRDYFFEDVPEIPWDKVGGQKEAINLIKETIEQPLLHPDIFERFDKKPIKGILLYGPPGCGKTLIGKATAYNLTKEYSKRVGHEVKEYFMYISGPKILNMWLGETERMVRDIFRIAREKAKEGRLVFIFMDEAESVLRTRSSGRWLNISNTVVPQFCAELDGLVSLENVVLMLTSNRPDYIDPAVLRPERIDRKIKINRPDKDSSRQILGIYLHENLPIDDGFMGQHQCDKAKARAALLDLTLEHLWQKSKQTEFLRIHYRSGQTETLYWKDLVSGALLKSIVDRAKDAAIRRAVADPSGDHGLQPDDLLKAVEAEYKENEIFPKSEIQEDWLKLLDVEPENVSSVKPIGAHGREDKFRREIL